MLHLFKKLFGLWLFCVILSACGVAVGPTGDASSESQSFADSDGAVTDGAVPSDDAPVVADGALQGDAQTPTDGNTADADAGVITRDTFDEPPPVCGGCYLGTACVPSTPMACGSNSACVRCPTPAVPECQEATCTTGACGVRNVPDGTGCTGGVCSRGACYRCGTNDNECCPVGNRCNPGLTCVGSTGTTFQQCTPCGTFGNACCGTGVGTMVVVNGTPVFRHPGGTCDAGLSCNAEGACTCGGLGEACCTGSVCREGRCRRDGTCGI